MDEKGLMEVQTEIVENVKTKWYLLYTKKIENVLSNFLAIVTTGSIVFVAAA